MTYNNLPGTNLKLSQISLGTMMFGGQTSEADSLSIMDRAYELGINFWDTASSYQTGETERIVGLGLRGRRDNVFVATKIYNRTGPNPLLDFGLSRRNIMSGIDKSLKRLGTDYVDLYYMHRPDPITDIEETLDAMSTLVRMGKVRYIGVSNFAAWQIADILAMCDKRGYIAPVISQNVYNTITRSVEPELVPFLKAHNIGMAVYNPVAAGLLTGKHKLGATPTADTRFANDKNYTNRYWTPENFAAVEKLTKIADDEGMSIIELAFRWCAARPTVTTIIAGVSRLSQLEQNAAMLEGPTLSAEAFAACDEVWRDLAGNHFMYMR